ncbi:MAG: hypothetical protein Q4A34_01530 [Candidatus Saccharibacteria bacterium]|nr:hypothetical protein [Candidatus Saccharibacteria bacterium]
MPEVPLPDSRRNELELAGLLSRLGEAALFPYFATEREERSSRLPMMNHDFYVIDSSGRKIPIQAKIRPPRDGREYDPAVLVLTRKELMHAARKVDIQHGGVSQLLVKEEFGRLNYCERRRLKALSGYVIDKVQCHIETMSQ